MQFSKIQIIEMSEGHFFGVGNAQLPSPPMLMVDTISHISQRGGSYGKGELIAALTIHPKHWFFDCHFKGDPVMPGCLGLDALWQLLGVFLGWSGLKGKGRALGVGSVKFRGQIYPDTKLIHYQLNIKKVIKLPMPVGVADGEVIVNGQAIYIAKDLKVGLLKHTTNHE